MWVFRTLTVMFLCLLGGNTEAWAADAYDIRSGDLLSVHVYRQDDMRLSVRVDG
jgi:protein involved in polysaccharide export with SLBB domain